ncbi:hypothetical protein CEXT_785221 [Caerostris extrusa]|uniref:Uncharacterized protein n=1 Tax=Caerostris extrusa TaxID=172846 RepID=A0AAV4YE83_CAEEX|nr:hypothetical protein CEXT_785221 [Caerostris extrusa]
MVLPADSPNSTSIFATILQDINHQLFQYIFLPHYFGTICHIVSSILTTHSIQHIRHIIVLKTLNTLLPYIPSSFKNSLQIQKDGAFQQIPPILPAYLPPFQDINHQLFQNILPFHYFGTIRHIVSSILTTHSIQHIRLHSLKDIKHPSFQYSLFPTPSTLFRHTISNILTTNFFQSVHHHTPANIFLPSSGYIFPFLYPFTHPAYMHLPQNLSLTSLEPTALYDANTETLHPKTPDKTTHHHFFLFLSLFFPYFYTNDAQKFLNHSPVVRRRRVYRPHAIDRYRTGSPLPPLTLFVLLQRNFAQEVRRLIRADPSFLPPNQTNGQVSLLWESYLHRGGTQRKREGRFFFVLSCMFGLMTMFIYQRVYVISGLLSGAIRGIADSVNYYGRKS